MTQQAQHGENSVNFKEIKLNRILTSHVGSLPRSQEVVDFIFARENNEKYDENSFDECMQNNVLSTVEKQKKAGIDIVSDGETSKISYATYVKDRYTGFSGDSPRNAPEDLKLFPGFLQRLADEGGTPQYARPMCTSEVKSKGQGELQKDIVNLKKAMTANGIERGFMNAASPGVISLFLQNDFYATRDTYLAALADAMRDEYETIVASGLDLQLDCPDLALSRHMLFSDLSDSEFIKIAESHMEALNHALKNVPAEKVRIHICWGNYEGPHCCDIDMNKVLGENNQALPFFIEDSEKTIGSLYSTSGPDLSDSVLGVQIINGKGDLLNFGGQVMKNVAGYDVSRLLVGSMGKLAVITQVSFKVFPEKMVQEKINRSEKKNDHSSLRQEIEKKLKDVFDPYGVFV